MDRSELIKAIEAYAKRHDIPEGRVTKRAVGASQLYRRLTNGGSCTLEVAARLREFLSKEERDAA